MGSDGSSASFGTEWDVETVSIINSSALDLSFSVGIACRNVPTARHVKSILFAKPLNIKGRQMGKPPSRLDNRKAAAMRRCRLRLNSWLCGRGPNVSA
jgi:hypothetical protein